MDRRFVSPVDDSHLLTMDHPESESVVRGFAGLAAELSGNPYLLFDVLDTIYDRVYLKDAEGQLIFGNQAFLKAFGLKAENVVGKRLREFLPSTMIKPCEMADELIYSQGDSACLETEWVDPATGQQRWSESHKAPLRDTAGKITGIVGVSRDVTSRRHTENELNRQKTLLELIIETVPDWIFVKDRQRRLLLGNRAYYQEQGLKPECVVGTDPTQDMPTEIQVESKTSDDAVLDTGQPQTGQLTITDPSGRDLYIEYRKMPLVEHGQVTGLVGVSRNLTEAKQAEEQLRRNENLLLHASRLASLGELSAGIAHEVNQPLFTILNYAKAIENKLSAEQEPDLASIQDWVRQIRNEAERGGKITRRLRSFAKPAESKRKLSSLNTLVTESIQFMKVEARDAGVSLTTELDEALPELVFDRIQIQQVFVNILKNAIDAFSEHQVDKPHVHISTRSNGSQGELLVSDNGPGVSDDIGKNILEPFQTTKNEGVGLGLAISNSIIVAHRGRLTFERNDSGGATFCVSLPTGNQATSPL